MKKGKTYFETLAMLLFFENQTALNLHMYASDKKWNMKIRYGRVEMKTLVEIMR